ncbi:hypothetical protein SLA2020_304290 [Shorea laevis]
MWISESRVFDILCLSLYLRLDRDKLPHSNIILSSPFSRVSDSFHRALEIIAADFFVFIDDYWWGLKCPAPIHPHLPLQKAKPTSLYRSTRMDKTLQILGRPFSESETKMTNGDHCGLAEASSRGLVSYSGSSGD